MRASNPPRFRTRHFGVRMLAAGLLATLAQGALAQIPPLGATSRGALYFEEHCVPSNDDGKIVVHLPGTGGTGWGSQQYLRVLGQQSGLCALSVPYDSATSLFGCCDDGTPGHEWSNPVCLQRALDSKAFADPPTYLCNGDPIAVSYANSIEGQIGAALVELGMTHYFTFVGEQIQVDWSKVVLTGHSQGAVFASYLGITSYPLQGIGSIAGGANRVSGGGFLPYVTSTSPVTAPSAHRAFHHVWDAAASRQAAYAAMGVPAANVRETNLPSAKCDPERGGNAHLCVISDNFLPFHGEQPVFAPDWLWLIAEGGPWIPI